MTSEATVLAPALDDDFHPYRAVSKAAVTSLVLSIFSLLLALVGLLLPAMLMLPFLGFVFGWVALRNLRSYPDELTGRIPAVAGMIVCGLLLFGGAAFHAVVYATEVPEGYERISFTVLKAPSTGPDVPTADALRLDGQNVFLKGYIHPSSVDGMDSLRKFVLVPDLGTCCFGDQPPLTHMIEVSVKGDDPVEYSSWSKKWRIAGVLHVDRRLKPVAGLTGAYYQLEAEYIK